MRSPDEPPRIEHVTRRDANRSVSSSHIVGIRKRSARISEAIQIRRTNFLVPKRSDRLVALVIREDEEDIWFHAISKTSNAHSNKKTQNK